MKKILKILMVTMLMVAAKGVGAADPFYYAGVQYGFVGYNEDNFGDISLGMVVARGGVAFTPHFALEGRLGFGVGDDTAGYAFRGEVIPVTAEVESYAAVVGIGKIPIGSHVEVYGLVGISQLGMAATASVLDASVSNTDSGLSYGVGLNLAVTKTAKVNVEYVRLLDEDAYTADSLNVGMVVSF